MDNTCNNLDTGSSETSVSTRPVINFNYERGPQGIPGEIGPQGEPGQDGTTFIPSLSEEGVLSWSNADGKENPPSVNIKGAVGAQGPKGDPGQGVPTGGSPGQVLSKATDTDYDTQWIDVSVDNAADTIAASPEKSSLVASDTIPLVDSEDSDALKKVKWSTMRSAMEDGLVDVFAPATHASTHTTDGDDPITPDSIGAAPTIRTASISLSSASWVGDTSPFSQAITVVRPTENTKVDLQPDASAIAQLIADGVAGVYIANDGGTLTAYAVGAKPTVDLTIQATLTEVLKGD